MPIGTGKVGLFGGIAIEAGSATFNAPGTFTVPAALKTVSLSGNGSTGNAGNPGNPGGDGIGGDGGDAHFMPSFYLPPGSNTRTVTAANPCSFNYVAVQRAEGGPGSSGGAYCPFINPPGGPGNPGNTGGATSALGYCWTAGAAGTGGTGGVDGYYGVPGGTGNFHGGPGTPLPQAQNRCPWEMRNANQIAPGGAGLASGGSGGGYAWNEFTTNAPYCCQTIRWSLAAARGGGGGGGGGIAPTASSGGNGNISYVNPINGNPSGCDGGGFGGTTSGGKGGGGSGVATGMGSSQILNIAVTGDPAGVARAGAGGGGAGSYAEAYQQAPCINNPAPASFSTGNGGGGGGSGSVGNPGSGAGNPGSAGTPATFNCVPVTTGCYPVQVGTGGQVIISWNDQ